MMPGLSSSTVQFVARLFAVTVCIAILGLVGVEGACIFVFGDGEAIMMINTLNAPLIALAGALGASALGHQVLTGLIAHVLGQVVPLAPPGASHIAGTETAQQPRGGT